MYSSVPYRRIASILRHKPGKPWRNDKLSEVWSRLSEAERDWLRGSGVSTKARLKTEYSKLCKLIDREFQPCKRLHCFSLQAELEQECN